MLASEPYDITLQTKYACKELIVKSFYDPILSGEMNQFIYEYLNRKRSIKVVSFSFNDVEKYIDITATGDTGKLCEFINEAFKNLYRQWVFGNEYIRLWTIDAKKAEMFRDIVTNDIDLIASKAFTLYSSILILSYGHLPEMDNRPTPIISIRVKLV